MDGASLAVAAFAFILYVNTLGAGFVYDDSRAVLRNPDVRGVDSAWLAFGHDFWGTPLRSAGSHGSYRPLSVLSLRANAYLAGGLRPHAFHLVNAQLHAVCSWLVSRLSRRLVGGWAWPVAGLLFAAHPVHCEAVAGIVGRADLLASALALLALLCFLGHVERRERRDRRSAADDGLSAPLLYATAVLAGAAMLCKETGLAVLAVCAAYDVVAQLARRRSRAFSGSSLAVLSLAGVALLGARLWVMGLRAPAFARADNPAAHAASWSTRALTFLYLPAVNLRLLLWPGTLSFDWSMDAIARVERLGDARNLQSVALYAGLAVLAKRAASALLHPKPVPKRQEAERFVSAAAPRRRAVSKRRTLKPERKMKICGVCSKIIESRHSYAYNFNNNNNTIMWNNNENNNNYSSGGGLALVSDEQAVVVDVPPAGAALVSLALLVFPLLPATNLFFYVGFVVAERVLYLPSVGYCLLVTQGLGWLATAGTNTASSGAARSRGTTVRAAGGGGGTTRPLVVLAVVVLVAALAARTLQRNSDWADEETLYRAGIPVNPPKAYGNLGSVLSSRGRLVEAEHAFRMALKYRPNMAEVHYNLGNLLLKREKLEEAIHSYQQAIHYRPSLALAHLHLGHAFAARGQVREAVSALARCASLALPAEGVVGVVEGGVRDEATHEAARVSALLLLGHLHAAHGRLRAAEAAVREAIMARPEDYQPAPLYKLLAEVEEKLKSQEEGQRHPARDTLDHREQREEPQRQQHAQQPAQEEPQRSAWAWRSRTRTCNDSALPSSPGVPKCSQSSAVRTTPGRASRPDSGAGAGAGAGPGAVGRTEECPLAALFPATVSASPCAYGTL